MPFDTIILYSQHYTYHFLALPHVANMIVSSKDTWKCGLDKSSHIVILTCSLGSGDERLSNLTDLEHGRSLHIIPVLLAEGINTENANEYL